MPTDDSLPVLIQRLRRQDETLRILKIFQHELSVDNRWHDSVEDFEECINRMPVGEEWLVLDSLDKEFFGALRCNRTLKALFLTEISMSDESLCDLFQALEVNEGLTEISLWGAHLRTPARWGSQLCSGLTNNGSLTKLALIECSLEDSAAQQLASAIESNEALLEIDLRQNQVADGGAAAIGRALQRPKNVTYLDLDGNPISRQGEREFLLFIKDNKTLEHLRLPSFNCSSNAQIRYQCADTLASSSDPSNLRAAHEIIQSIPDEADVSLRAKWLLPFIEDQLGSVEIGLAHEELSPDYINRWLIVVVAQIGVGQFGKVYLAQFEGRWVAVKILTVDLALQEDKSIATNIMRERLANRILHSHRIANLVKYVGLIDTEETSQRGLVFELCADIPEDLMDFAETVVSRRDGDNLDDPFDEGNCLEDWSDRVVSSLRSAVVFATRPRGGYTLQTVVEMLSKVAQALKRVHDLGFLHRDLAARNVLCDGDGNVQLADFGLAKYVGRGAGEHTETDPINNYGTYLTPGHQYALAWWPPECIPSGDNTEAVFSSNSDVYSFGVLLWQCFAHRDPFDEVRPVGDDAAHLQQAATRIAAKILNGERPEIQSLDDDTPCRLIELMEDCWETDPEERPTVSMVIAELESILSSGRTPKRRKVVVRDSRRLKKKWFDIKRIYLSLPLSELRGRADALPEDSRSASYSYREWLRRIADARHEIAPSQSLSPHILSLMGERKLFDVFLAHTGAQKKDVVASLADSYQKCGFECFLDSDMNASDMVPTEAMRFALETSRYCVVVISKEFLEKDAPVQELAYAYKRREFFRLSGDFKWESLQVILFNMTVSEYKDALRHDERLPDLGSGAVLHEWASNGCGYHNWPHLYNSIKTDMIAHDNNDGALEEWRRFLTRFGSLAGFPRAASSVYVAATEIRPGRDGGTSSRQESSDRPKKPYLHDLTDGGKKAILSRVLSFVGNVRDFHRCELSFKALKSVLSDPNSSLWENATHSGESGVLESRGEDEWAVGVKTHRECAEIKQNLFEVESQQKQEDAPIPFLDVLEDKGFDDLLNSISPAYVQFIGWDPQTHAIQWRCDSREAIGEIVVANLVVHLQHAYLLSIERAKLLNDAYPELKCSDLELLKNIGRLNVNEAADIVLDQDALLERVKRDKIVRQCAFRAGVVKMANDCTSAVWGLLVKLIGLLIRRVHVNILHYDYSRPPSDDSSDDSPDDSPRRPFQHEQVPPSSWRTWEGVWYNMKNCRFIATPGFVETAARELDLEISKVYGCIVLSHDDEWSDLVALYDTELDSEPEIDGTGNHA